MYEVVYDLTQHSTEQYFHLPSYKHWVGSDVQYRKILQKRSQWDVFIYLIVKLEYTVWGSWALFRVAFPMKMYGTAVFDGVFFASLSHECDKVKAH